MGATSKTSDKDIPQLNWAFSSMGCQELDLADIARLARQYGIRQVELRAVANQLNIPELAARDNWLDQSAEALLGTADVSVLSFSASAKLSQPFAETAVEIEAFAPLLQHFGSQSLRVFDGTLDLDAGYDAIWHWLDAWEGLRETRGWSFNLAVETHDSLLDASRITALFAKGHPHVELLWDSHHTWKKGGQDPLTLWPQVKPWTRLIHIKDSVSKPSVRHPFSYVLPGEGEFPFIPLIDCLASDGYQGAVSLEWERLWHPYLPPLEKALQTLFALTKAQ